MLTEGPISPAGDEPEDMISPPSNPSSAVVPRADGHDVDAERLLIDATARGAACDLVPGHDGARPVIRAETVVALMLGENGLKATSRGVRLSGAKITGTIDLEFATARLDGAPIPILRLVDCELTHALKVTQATLEGISLGNSTLPALEGVDLQLRRNLGLSGTTVGTAEAPGGINLTGARIAGGLFANSSFQCFGGLGLSQATVGEIDLRGARLSGTALCLNLGDARIAGSLNMDDVQAAGPVSARRMHVTGSWTIVGGQTIPGRLIAGDGQTAALSAWGADVGGNLSFVNLEVEGGVDLSAVKVGAIFIFARVRLAGSLDCTDAVLGVTAELAENSFTPRGQDPGRVILRGAKAGLLDDEPNAWPSWGQLHLDDFKYERLGKRIPNRLEWVRRHDKAARFKTFHPQPYEQLTTVLRQTGYTREADQVAIAKRRARMQTQPLGSKAMAWLLWITSDFGYSPSRAVVSTALFALIGSVGLVALMAAGLIHAIPTGIHGKVEVSALQMVVGIDLPWRDYLPEIVRNYIEPRVIAEVPNNCPALVPPLYAVDMIVPVLDLGQESACRLEAPGGFAGNWIQAGRALYQILGAIMTAILITTLTGVMRRE